MQQFSLCFDKVKKICLKFIKSQETKTDKFKNKERMIKSFLIPLCFWISKKANKKNQFPVINFHIVIIIFKSSKNSTIIVLKPKLSFNLLC